MLIARLSATPPVRLAMPLGAARPSGRDAVAAAGYDDLPDHTLDLSADLLALTDDDGVVAAVHEITSTSRVTIAGVSTLEFDLAPAPAAAARLVGTRVEAGDGRSLRAAEAPIGVFAGRMTRTATTITATDVPEGCTVEAVFVVDAGAGTGPAWQVSTALADDQRVDLGDDLVKPGTGRRKITRRLDRTCGGAVEATMSAPLLSVVSSDLRLSADGVDLPVEPSITERPIRGGGWGRTWSAA